MVKRDRTLAFQLQLPKWVAVLIIIACLLIAWGLLFRWPSLPLVIRAGLAVVFVFVFPYYVAKQARQGKQTINLDQWRHVEYLRMHPEQAPLSVFQPEADPNRLVLPMVMMTRLSARVYVSLAVFWMALFGVILLVMELLRDTARSGSALLLCGILGAIVMSFVGMLSYQRLEVTEQAFLLQRRLRRQRLRWEEAKLFAIVRVMDGEDAPRFYELSGEHALLRWPTFPPGRGAVSRPKGREEYEHMLHDLLACMRARTDLPLLNLS